MRIGFWTTKPWIFPCRIASTKGSLASKPTNTTPLRSVVDPGVSVLRTWIAHRVDAMWAAGWPDEVRRLAVHVPEDAPAWQASGYGVVRDMVAGRLTPEAARETVIIATRQYAKRQRTWFRHQLPADGVTRLDPAARDAVATLRRLVQEWHP